MASERKFINKALSDFEVKQFLERELSSAGVSYISIQKTPIATRIAIVVRRPGLVVGKKGKTIKEIAEALQNSYSVENPQIEVIEVQNPALDAKLMAEKIGKQLEMKGNIKPAMRFALREIMSAGALGAEIRAAGKLVGKGGKAKATTIRAGFLKKSGEESKKLKVARYTAHLKSGTVGITVKLVPPGTIFSDQVDISLLKLPVERPIEEKKEETQIKEEKKKRIRKKTTKKVEKVKKGEELEPAAKETEEKKLEATAKKEGEMQS